MVTRQVSKETGSTVEWSEEDNYKFRLSAFREQLLERYTSKKVPMFYHMHHVRGTYLTRTLLSLMCN